MTTDPGEDFGAVWSPDGTRLAFSGEEFHTNEGPHAVWQTGREGRIEQLMRTPGDGQRSNWDFPTSWSPDGRWIAYTRTRRNNPDVEVIPTAAPGTSRPVATDSNANEYGAVFSPDSRFIADASDEFWKRGGLRGGIPGARATYSHLDQRWHRAAVEW